MFNKGGRLFRIAFLFSIICLLAMVIMVYFTHRCLVDMKDIALEATEERVDLVLPFYTKLIDNLKIGTVLGSLSAVLMAVAARYGLRETAQNIGNTITNIKNNGEGDQGGAG
jgi:hypothetical protein